ncbi:MAG: 50S ribosomal protein L18 [Ignavibacteriaceae bacterium]|nr:MAG: 50S ribosomal protein L18 [Ignavibacteriaceae bacterium]MBV6443812.1 50S ribosomal protein L18 [Ignavibacteriaceae bacterium]OQY80010.1 MAG: 50S ribosomal protein L18 [Ignavibacteriales bacterium UTCHB3]WKZ71519.1 MAG: 50S ribosomal protein L18 [Ignavibacteriaceae bacterium]
MSKKNSRERIKRKIRGKISGTSEVPRLTVTRSLNQIYAQLIDDLTGTTVLAGSSLSKDIQDELKKANGKTARSKVVGEYLAKKAIEKKIETVVFDRNGYKYHGRVKALADGLREGGLKF